MFAILYCFGYLPVIKERFMIMVRDVFNLSLNSFRIRFGIVLILVLVLILPIMLIISFSVTGCR